MGAPSHIDGSCQMVEAFATTGMDQRPIQFEYTAIPRGDTCGGHLD